LPFDYDKGHDPSLLSGAKFRNQGGVPTWGVCRADVRNAIRPGDLVVFFAAGHKRQFPIHYYFTGFATVSRKIRQSAIWLPDEFAVYGQYRNPLIRPRGGGFERSEPGRTPKDWHKDRLWRIVDRKRHDRRGIRSDQAGEFLSAGVECAANHVLFQSHYGHTWPSERASAGAG